jgi:phosphoheptose isomerase
MRIAVARFLTSCVVGLAVPACLLGELITAGAEFQANTRVIGSQNYPAAAVDQQGDFVITWQSYGQDGANRGVFARRFSSAGVGLGIEFQVNTYTSNTQSYPSIALDADGDFVVVWSSNLQDGSGYGVFGRRFDSAGTPLAIEFQANNYTLGFQSGAVSPTNNGGPTVASDNSGRFVVAWQGFSQDGSGSGIFARQFDAAGGALGAEFQVNTYTISAQLYPSVSLDFDGDFVVSWQSFGQDGNGDGIFARRFTSAGTALASEFQVNIRTTNGQRYPTVDLGNTGQFVVTWQSYGQDGETYGILARRFASSGSPVGGEIQVNTYTTSAQRFPTVALESDGDFVIAWASYGQDGAQNGVFAQRFSAFGQRLASEFQVNSFTTGNQSGDYGAAGNSAPAVGMNGSGDFVVAWHSYAQDGAQGGVFAQRYDNIAILDVDGNGSTTPLTDGLLVLRFLFGFTGNTLVAGAVDQIGCVRCDATAIQAYLQTLI